MDSIPCTVGIITFNEDKVLKVALESVSDFEQIIICDGGSTDETLNLARAFGAEIIKQDPQFKYPNNKIRNFSGVRNQTLEHARFQWFLYIDSDEYLSPEVVAEVRSIIESKKEASAYWIPRKYVVNGKVIDCASTYPSKQIRFFNRRVTKKFIKEIHERIETTDSTPIKTLKNYMYVPMESDAKKVREKWNYYLDIEAERRGEISVLNWIGALFQNTKVSILFLFRLVRNFVFCRGNRMPFDLEMERHYYHYNMLKKFWELITLGKKNK